MAQYTAYANYVIYFRDETEYNDAIALAGGFFFQHCPQTAAATFGVTYPHPGGPLGDSGIYFPTVLTPGINIGHPLPSGIILDDAIDTFLVPGQAGVPASIWPAGPDMLLVWCATIIRAGGAAGASPAPAANIPKRRWIDGFEVPSLVDGGSGTSNQSNRAASRTCDGLGFALRNDTNKIRTHTLIQHGAASDSSRSWERFYVRLRTANPTSPIFLWNSGSNSSGIEGGLIKINTSGQLEVYNRNDVGTETLLGTSAALTLNAKHKIDIAVFYSTKANGAAGGEIIVWINGVQFVDGTVVAGGGGLGQGGRTHERSNLGNNDAVANTYELDLDSWINAQIPVAIIGGAVSFTSIDFLAGSHVSKQWNLSLNAGVNWADPRLESTNQLANPSQVTTTARTVSTTANARLNVRSDYTEEQNSIGVKLGAAAAEVGLWSENAAGTDGTLGYELNGGGPVMASINQLNAPGANQVAYLPSGMNLPTVIEPLDVIHDKSNDANQDNTYGMQVFVENIGTFGQEDDPDSDISPIEITHNAYYPNTLFSFVGPLPDAPVFAVGGTYVGNGTSQHIDLPAPAHFIWIRPLTGGLGGVKWYSAGLGGHFGDSSQIVPDHIVRAWVDSSNVSKFTVNGPSAQVNQNAVTFQYIAFCDPGMRFNICGAYRHAAALASAINALLDTVFTPVAAFVQNELAGSSGSASQLFYKGAGNAGTTGVNMQGASQANFGSFAAGQLISRASIHGTDTQANYSVWRTSDGTGVMCQVMSYIGDGVSPRTITLTPTSGRFPLFAIVMPQNGSNAVMRDPSNAGTTSNRVDTTASVAANGIRGAIAVDQIIVGSDLNANLAVYDVFVIPGDTAGWNNGTFYPPSIGAPGDLWPIPNDDPADISVVGEGGLVFAGEASLLLIEDIGGIYELVPGKRNDTILTRSDPDTLDVEIPDPFAETGYIGG